MKAFQRLLFALQKDMQTPTPYGWYHWLWIVLGVVAVAVLYSRRRHAGEKQLKWVLGVYGVVALTTEILKQLAWTLSFSETTGLLVLDYQWYAAPFQLCSTPIYVSLMCVLLKKGKLREHLLAYLAYITISGGLMAMVIPTSCFTSDILVNIHTMWLHCGSLVVSIYLLMSRAVPVTVKSLRYAAVTFLCTAGFALLLNIFVYHTQWLDGETFNMFYISPYFPSELPVFSTIQANAPYPVFLATYLIALLLGSGIVYAVARLILRLTNHVNNGCNAPVHN